MITDYGSRDLLLMCRSKYEINRMRDYVSRHPNPDLPANGFFFQLSADCLRYIEALEKVGIHANNIENMKQKAIADIENSHRKESANEENLRSPCLPK